MRGRECARPRNGRLHKSVGPREDTSSFELAGNEDEMWCRTDTRARRMCTALRARISARGIIQRGCEISPCIVTNPAPRGLDIFQDLLSSASRATWRTDAQAYTGNMTMVSVAAGSFNISIRCRCSRALAYAYLSPRIMTFFDRVAQRAASGREENNRY